MDIAHIKDNLLNLSLSDSDHIKDVGSQVADTIRNKRLEIINLVVGLDPVLTNINHSVRYRGVELLCNVITSLDTDSLSQKEIEVLSEFACTRLMDHQSMEPPTLKCLSYFIDCKSKPPRFNKTTLEFLSTKINVRKMEVRSRHKVYEIAKKIVIDKRRDTDTIDSDLIYSLIHMIEGESNPENLLLCFGIISYVMKNFHNLDPFIDDLFEWLSSYYPIDYAPNEQQNIVHGSNITRSDLVTALYDCFYANELNSANLQTLLLEKLDSTELSIKLESLNCLTKCYQLFPIASIKDYASSLWTFIRVECLKRVSLVETELLESCYRALSALTMKLGEDDAIYFNFLSDLYEELSIAFKKPELDLYDPSARLLFNAARPRVKGVNYILSKILPLALNAISFHELRPLGGLDYVSKELQKDESLISGLDQELVELLEKLSVYKKHYEWLLRELLKILSNLRPHTKEAKALKIDEDSIPIVYQCLNNLIRYDTSGNLQGLLESLVDLNLLYATDAETSSVRKSAMICLTNIASSIKTSELLLLRSRVVDKLKPCLADRKRLVRQAAAEARMKWIMIGQPGS